MIRALVIATATFCTLAAPEQVLADDLPAKAETHCQNFGLRAHQLYRTKSSGQTTEADYFILVDANIDAFIYGDAEGGFGDDIETAVTKDFAADMEREMAQWIYYTDIATSPEEAQELAYATCVVEMAYQRARQAQEELDRVESLAQ